MRAVGTLSQGSFAWICLWPQPSFRSLCDFFTRTLVSYFLFVIPDVMTSFSIVILLMSCWSTLSIKSMVLQICSLSPVSHANTVRVGSNPWWLNGFLLCIPWQKNTIPLNPCPAEPGYTRLCKQCRSRSVGFWRNQLIWICTVCH